MHPKTAGDEETITADLVAINSEDIQNRSLGLSEMPMCHADQPQHLKPVGYLEKYFLSIRNAQLQIQSERLAGRSGSIITD
jgi:hypothetical protein